MTPPAKKAAAKDEPEITPEEKIEAAKAKADEGAPPAKRATKLSKADAERHPELQDEAWVAGNPAQAKALTS